MTIYLDFVSYTAHYIILFYYFVLSPVFCVWPKHVISLYPTNARTFRIMAEKIKTHIWESIISCWNFSTSFSENYLIHWLLNYSHAINAENKWGVGWEWNAMHHKQSTTCSFCGLVPLEDASLLIRASPKSWEIKAMKAEFVLVVCTVCLAVALH